MIVRESAGSEFDSIPRGSPSRLVSEALAVDFKIISMRYSAASMASKGGTVRGTRYEMLAVRYEATALVAAINK
jgi:hypothetical protein